MNDIAFRNTDYEQPSDDEALRSYMCPPSSSSVASAPQSGTFATHINTTPKRRNRRKTFGGGSSGESSRRRSLSSEAEAARAKRDRRIERAVESAIVRRAELEARKTCTDPQDVARRLRRQRQEDAFCRQMEKAKRRISRDLAKRERMHSRAAHAAATRGGKDGTFSGGCGSSSRSVDTSTTYASTYRSSSWDVEKSSASGDEPALSGWLDKRKERKRATCRPNSTRSVSAIDRRSASSLASAHRSSASVASNASRKPKSALRASRYSPSASWTGNLRQVSFRGSRGEAHYNYDDAGTVASAETFNTRDTQSLGDKMRALSFHPKPSNIGRDTRTDRNRDKDDRSVRSSRSTRSHRSREGGVVTTGSTSSSARRLDHTRSSCSVHELDGSSHSAFSLRSTRTSRSCRSASGDDMSVRSSRSNHSYDASAHSNSRSQRRSSRSKKRRDDEDGAASVKSSNWILSPPPLSRKEKPKVQIDLEDKVVRLKLLIANARTEEEEERHHACRIANVNDRLRNLFEEQKNRAKQAKEDVHRLDNELERVRKLKAEVAPQVQQNRTKARPNRHRPSTDGSGGGGGGGGRGNLSGASLSSWSVGNSLGDSFVSLHSLVECVERGLAGLEQELVVPLNTTSESSGSRYYRNG